MRYNRVATLVPAICYAMVALCLMFIYPLTKAKVEENVAILAARRAAENKDKSI